MHTDHPDVHDGGLVDDCPACLEAAEYPIGNLDETMLRQLVTRLLDDRFRRGPGARCYTEALAMANVMNVLERVGKLAEVAPDEVQWYLVERWKVDLASGTTALSRAEAALGPGLLSENYDAQRRVREALRGYVTRRGDMVPGATAEDWLRAAAELLNDLVVALGPECPPLEQIAEAARRQDLEP